MSDDNILAGVHAPARNVSPTNGATTPKSRVSFDEDKQETRRNTLEDSSLLQMASRSPSLRESRSSSMKRRSQSIRGHHHERHTTMSDFSAVHGGEVARRRRFLIDPRHSNFMGPWDAVTTVALIITAIFTPFEVAFVAAKPGEYDGFFVLNRCVDAVFIFDMLLAFFVMYDETGLLHAS